jgi:hypothetical protein
MTRFRFKLKGGYVIGSLSIPTACGAVNVQAVGGSKAQALMRAATIAQRISDDPVMRAMMPPQAQAAILAAKALSVAARAGAPQLKRLWRKLKGPGKRRLAAALVEEAEKPDVGETRYQTSYKGVRHTNRGAWQEWQDPYHDADDDDDDAEGYEADYSDVELSGRRRRRRKRKERKERKERKYEDPDAPVDEPKDAAPVDEQPQQPTDEQPPTEGEWQ